MVTCKVPACSKRVKARGLCSAHYMRHRTNGIRDGTWAVYDHGQPGDPYVPPDLDECGLGTRWGCGAVVRYGESIHVLRGGRKPQDVRDTSDVTFHVPCSPATVEPDAVQMWSGTYTARRESAQVRRGA